VKQNRFIDFFCNFVFLDNTKMIDKIKQIEYWIEGAEEDLSTAELLIREKRILHGLFFCHLVIEKAIKAHIVKTSGEVA